MRENPDDGLYATNGLDHWVDSVHIESIPTRSSLNNWVIEPHSHRSFIQLLYLTRGGGEIGFGDDRFFVKAPCLLSIPEQNVHSYTFLPQVDGPVITAVQHVLELIIGAADPDMLSVLREPFSIQFAPDDPALGTLEPLFDAIAREFQSHQVAQPGICMSLLAALIMRIGRVRHRQGLTLEAGSTRKAQLIHRFRALVDERYRAHDALGTYADKLGVTVGHLSRLCRDVLGMSALAVINERAVYEAKRDLFYTSDSVKSLAWKLGFEDEVYFSRFFKKHTGLSPIQFREQARDQSARNRR